jgi:tripartite-type tricarboxylate transporter receptor subunit TctC
MIMKKLIVFILAVVLVLSTLSACGDKPAMKTTAADAAVAETTVAPADETTVETVGEEILEKQTDAWVPTKEIKCIVPFAPGGGSDILTRTIMDHIELPVNMVAINVEGGAGLVGAEQAATSAADGYTILAHNPMNLIAQGLTGTNELWNELTLLAFIVDDWTVVSTNKESGWKTVDDFVEAAKKSPNTIKWGVTGSGITMADSIRALKGLEVECTVVPYDGGADTRAALLGNHIQVELSTSSDIRSYVESGDVIPLFVIGTVRCPFIDVPTLLELGVDVTSGAPRAYFAPPNTDESIVSFYTETFDKLCKDEKFVESCADLGFVVSFVDSKTGTEMMNTWYEANLPIFEEEGMSQ